MVTSNLDASIARYCHSPRHLTSLRMGCRLLCSATSFRAQNYSMTLSKTTVYLQRAPQQCQEDDCPSSAHICKTVVLIISCSNVQIQNVRSIIHKCEEPTAACLAVKERGDSEVGSLASARVQRRRVLGTGAMPWLWFFTTLSPRRLPPSLRASLALCALC